MVETGVVLLGAEPIYWHVPAGRTGGSLPDSRALWDVLWGHRGAEDLGFAHSHPGSGPPGPSWTDLTTFAAVELGLGRRLSWWITSTDSVVLLKWRGPGKHEYEPFLVDEVLDWVLQLRKHSTGEQP